MAATETASSLSGGLSLSPDAQHYLSRLVDQAVGRLAWATAWRVWLVFVILGPLFVFFAWLAAVVFTTVAGPQLASYLAAR